MVRMPEKPKQIKSILRSNGHGPSLDAGRIPDEYVDWRASFGRKTSSMRNERDMQSGTASTSGATSALSGTVSGVSSTDPVFLPQPLINPSSLKNRARSV